MSGRWQYLVALFLIAASALIFVVAEFVSHSRRFDAHAQLRGQIIDFKTQSDSYDQTSVAVLAAAREFGPPSLLVSGPVSGVATYTITVDRQECRMRFVLSVHSSPSVSRRWQAQWTLDIEAERHEDLDRALSVLRSKYADVCAHWGLKLRFE